MTFADAKQMALVVLRQVRSLGDSRYQCKNIDLFVSCVFVLDYNVTSIVIVINRLLALQFECIILCSVFKYTILIKHKYTCKHI